ncbi:CoA transferase [Rhodococcus sp. T2V]|uniref:CaiB/BaiF CoA transferase family protein n=1 Tax=Rhodococcus sp. T2V TaxID=3034164 RepID=UPI0023E118D2|nr:CoA transferase [Rhodococcus sp. T2V]MDF3309613.1 CoA transferase [Rhodococcus sp. T2V]
MGDLPLAGIRIVDFTQALSGPYCTLQLADLGADVVKVERAGAGDDTRRWGPPFVGDTAAYFLSVNRNKRSVELDLKSDFGREAAIALVGTADVVIENWRPGTADRLGLGHQQLRELYPHLIYCSISGFGADSPRAGYDQVVQGTAGWMSLTGSADGEPFKTGVPIADVASGMFAAQAILAALVRRDRTDEGAYIDLAMQDALIAMLTYHAGSYFATGRPATRNGNHHATLAPYGTFATADGQVNIAVGNDGQWHRLCAALNLPGLADDPRFADNRARVEHRQELHAVLGAALKLETTTTVLASADRAGVPAGAIRDLAEVFTDPATLERGMVLEADHPRLGSVRAPGAAWRIDGDTATVRMPPPDLGQHTTELLTELGLTESSAEPVDVPA